MDNNIKCNMKDKHITLVDVMEKALTKDNPTKEQLADLEYFRSKLKRALKRARKNINRR